MSVKARREPQRTMRHVVDDQGVPLCEPTPTVLPSSEIEAEHVPVAYRCPRRGCADGWP